MRVFSVPINVEFPALEDASRQTLTIWDLLCFFYPNRIATGKLCCSSTFVMVAFVNELGWWALPAAIAVGVGLYLWRASAGSGRRGAPGEFLSVEEVRERLNAGEKLVLADVRSESAYDSSATTASGAVRLHPAQAIEDARRLGLGVDSRIVTFCA